MEGRFVAVFGGVRGEECGGRFFARNAKSIRGCSGIYLGQKVLKILGGSGGVRVRGEDGYVVGVSYEFKGGGE